MPTGVLHALHAATIAAAVLVGAPSVVTAQTDEPEVCWSASMTAGDFPDVPAGTWIVGYAGFSDPPVGSISDSEIEYRGSTFTLYGIWLYLNPELDEGLPTHGLQFLPDASFWEGDPPLVLRVGAVDLPVSETVFRGTWDVQGLHLAWAAGQEVSLALVTVPGASCAAPQPTPALPLAGLLVLAGVLSVASWRRRTNAAMAD